MSLKNNAVTVTALLLIVTLLAGCGSTPTTPDNSREEMEQRRDDTFRELR